MFFTVLIYSAAFFAASNVLRAEELVGQELLNQVEKELHTDIVAAAKIAGEAELYFKSFPSPNLESRLYNVVSHINILQSNYQQAFTYAIKARQIATEHGIAREEAESYRKEGLLLMFSGQYAESLELLSRALSIHESINSDLVFNSLDAITKVYGALNNIEKNLEYASLVFERPEAQGRTVKRGIAEAQLGKALLKAGNYGQARVHFENTIDIWTEHNISYVGEMYVNLAEIEYIQGDLVKALDYLSLGEDLSKQKSWSQGYAESLLLRAKIYKDMSKVEESIEMLHMVIDYSKKRKEKDAQNKAYEQLSYIYEQQGEFELALQNQKKFKALTDSIFNDRQAVRLSINQVRFETEQQAQKIIQLTSDKELADLERAQQEETLKLRAYIIFLGVLVLIGGIVFYIRAIRAKRALQAYSETLNKVNSDLKLANQAKNDFLARMSHEIRTPLTAVIGYAESILAGEVKGSEQLHAIATISDSGKHLLVLINDILDLSKIEANKLQVECIPTHLFVLLSEVKTLMQKRANTKGLEFDLEYELPLPDRVVTDPTRLKQILFNLCSNAIKFTEQGAICIKVSSSNGQLIFAVKDTGVGISESEMHTLFEAFEQADISVTRKYGGTGLGLNISQHLSNKLGGEISVQSTPGKGSVFSVSIALDVANGCKWLENSNEVREDVNFQFSQNGLHTELQGKVLLAEDHAIIRRMICQLLEQLGLSVSSVENGEQLVEAALHDEFDVILSDINMPVMGGVEALAMLKAAGCTIPVVALTANAMSHEVEDYMKAGFRTHLAKPVDRDKFVRVMSEILKEKQFVERDRVAQ